MVLWVNNDLLGCRSFQLEEGGGGGEEEEEEEDDDEDEEDIAIFPICA